MAYSISCDAIANQTAKWNNLDDHCLLVSEKEYSDRKVYHWLMETIRETFDYERSGAALYESHYVHKLQTYLDLYQLSFSTDNGKMMLSYFPDSKMRLANRRYKAKTGKVLRKLFPEIDDVTIQQMDDSYRRRFDVTQFEYKVGKTPEDFESVYRLYHDSFTNPATTYYRKSLANSCMGGKYEFDNQKHHPCAAYGSGDFEIHYMLSQNGKLAARAVVNIAKDGIECRKTNAPVYGVSELSMDELETKMKAADINQACDGDWNGATIIAQLERRGEWAAPYLDLGPRSYEASDEYEEDKLHIADNGNVSGNHHQGTQEWNGNSCRCENCGERINDGDSYYLEDDEMTLCSNCYYELTFCCECCEERHSVDSSFTIYVMERGRQRSRDYCETCRDEETVLASDGDYWHMDDTIFCEYEDEWVSPNCLDNGNYFVSDNDGEIYPDSQMAEMEDGDHWSIDEAENEGYEINESGIWQLPELNPLPFVPYALSRPALPCPATYDSHVALWSACVAHFANGDSIWLELAIDFDGIANIEITETNSGIAAE